MKTYEILAKYYTTIIVKAETEEEALEIAGDVFSDPRGVDLDEMSVDRTLSTDDQIADAIRFSECHKYDSQKTPYESE